MLIYHDFFKKLHFVTFAKLHRIIVILHTHHDTEHKQPEYDLIGFSGIQTKKKT